MNTTNKEVPANASQENPYVGPRTFTSDQYGLFFGRENEARRLLSLVTVKRFVIFYAESGAGKSSLIYARLIPWLREKRGFEVFPVGRLSGTFPPSLKPDNAFIYSLMNRLDREAENPKIFAKMPLVDFLQGYKKRDGKFCYKDPARAEKEQEDETDIKPRVLIIDQFEELFTHHLEAWDKRPGFFDQLSDAMEAYPDLIVVLAMREDYLAKLSPFARRIPGAMRSRFYMQRMGKDAALDAIIKPARIREREFAEGVAKDLRADLLTIDPERVTGDEEGEDGRTPVFGEFVEPLQLQVVCSQLWERVKNKPPGEMITNQDRKEAGNVEKALANYYDSALNAVLLSEEVTISERELREWFEDNLITAASTRGNVYLDYKRENAAGIPINVVDSLVEERLLRKEVRARGTWVELIHDGFVKPIERANQKWKEKQGPLFTAAEAWRKAGGDNNQLLYYDKKQLAKAKAEFADSRPDPLVEEFLDASQEEANRRTKEEADRRTAYISAMENAETERKRADEQARTARIMRYIAIGLGILLVVILLLTRFSYQQFLKLHAGELIGEAQRIIDQKEEDYVRISILLTLEAQRFLPDRANAQLADMVKEVPHPKWKRLKDIADDSPTVNAVWSPDGSLIASHVISGSDGRTSIKIWDAVSELKKNTVTADNLDIDKGDLTVKSLALSRDGNLLAVGLDNGEIRVWDIVKRNLIKPPNRNKSGIMVMAWNPKNDTLATVSKAGKVLHWEWDSADELGEPTLVSNIGQFAEDSAGLAWNPEGDTLAFSSLDHTVSFWQVGDDESITLPREHNENVLSITWDPGGRRLASGSRDRKTVIWDTTKKESVYTSPPREGSVLEVGWSLDGHTLVSMTDDGKTHYLDTDDLKSILPVEDFIKDEPKPLKKLSVDLGPGASTYIMSRQNGDLILGQTAREEELEVRFLDISHTNPVTSTIAWSPDSHSLAAVGEDGTVRLWDAVTGDLRGSTSLEAQNQEAVSLIAWNPNSDTLATASGPGDIILWNVNDNEFEKLLTLKREGANTISSMAWNKDGSILTFGFTDGAIKHYNTQFESFESYNENPDETQLNPEISLLAWSPDASIYVSVSKDGAAKLWNFNPDDPNPPITIIESITAQSPIGVAESDRNIIHNIAWDPSGQFLAAGTKEGVKLLKIKPVEQWDQESPNDIATSIQFAVGQSETIDLAWNPGGHRLASSTKDGKITLWYVSKDSIAGKKSYELPLSLNEKPKIKNNGNSLAWSPDGNTLSIHYDSERIKLWPNYYTQDPCFWIDEYFEISEWIELELLMLYGTICPNLYRDVIPPLIDISNPDENDVTSPQIDSPNPDEDSGSFLGSLSNISRSLLLTSRRRVLVLSSVLVLLMVLAIMVRPSLVFFSRSSRRLKPISSFRSSLYAFTAATSIFGAFGVAFAGLVISQELRQRHAKNWWLQRRSRWLLMMIVWIVGVAITRSSILLLTASFLIGMIIGAIISAIAGIFIVWWLTRGVVDQSPMVLNRKHFNLSLYLLTAAIWYYTYIIIFFSSGSLSSTYLSPNLMLVGAFAATINGLVNGLLLRRRQDDNNWLLWPRAMWLMSGWIIGVAITWYIAAPFEDDGAFYAALITATAGILIIRWLTRSAAGQTFWWLSRRQFTWSLYGLTIAIWYLFIVVGVFIWDASSHDSESRNLAVVGALGAAVNGLVVGLLLRRRQPDNKWLHQPRSIWLFTAWVVIISITWLLLEVLYDDMGSIWAGLISGVCALLIVWRLCSSLPDQDSAPTSPKWHPMTGFTWAIIGLFTLFWVLFSYYGRDFKNPEDLLIFGVLGTVLISLPIGFLIRYKNPNQRWLHVPRLLLVFAGWILAVAAIWYTAKPRLEFEAALISGFMTVLIGWALIWLLTRTDTMNEQESNVVPENLSEM